MVADTIDIRDVDLSHLFPQVAYAVSPEASHPARVSFRYLSVGFFASCVIHAMVLFTNWWQQSIPTKKNEPTMLRIQLEVGSEPTSAFIVDSKPASLPETMLPADTSPAMNRQAFPEASKSKPPVTKPEVKVKAVQPLAAEELREIVQNHASTEPAMPANSIARNVFHPSLRQRLIEEERKPELQRADAGPKTHTDPSGATIVDLGGGKCLRSSVPKLGQVQNWYMTSCGGTSESEQIMERVNNAVNGKLRFEE